MNKSMVIMMMLKPMLTDEAVAMMMANVFEFAQQKEAEHGGRLSLNIELTKSDICLRIYKRIANGTPELVSTHYGSELKADHVKSLMK